MDVEVLGVSRLRYDDGAPVRSASAVVPFGGGFLVVSDDATRAAWFREDSVTAVRLVPPVGGHEVFEAASGTKHLKPDLETACQVTVDGPAVLVMGSGSSPARMTWSLLRLQGGDPVAVVADMSPLYDAVAVALSVDRDVLNLEGACVVGPALRWFHRGLPTAGLPSGSVDLDLAAALRAVIGQDDPGAVRTGNPLHYDLGRLDGTGLAVTDVVALPDGTCLASAAAEDSPNPRDDGPVVGAALVRLDGDRVLDVVSLPEIEGRVVKVEGLMVLESDDREVRLLAVVDVDDPQAASWSAQLLVHL